MSSEMLREEDRQDVVERELEIYGDKLITKQSNILRLVFLNVNSIPVSNESPKNNMLYQSIVESEADIVGMSETNRNWNLIDSNHRWYDRTRGWFENSHSSLAHNTTNLDSAPYQPGGNLLLSIDKAAHRVFEKDKDPTGLGRWTSTVYRGKRNIKLRVITAYRACRSAGPNSAYMQKSRYLDAIKRGICPRQALLQDLGEAIKTSHNNGEQVVLMMDCNSNVQDSQFQAWIEDIGLENGLLDEACPIMPATYHRGSQPIDGIFISPSLQAVNKGFLEFGYYPSDHRAL